MLANLNFALFLSLWRVQVFVGVTLFTYEFFIFCFFFSVPRRDSVVKYTRTLDHALVCSEKSQTDVFNGRIR